MHLRPRLVVAASFAGVTLLTACGGSSTGAGGAGTTILIGLNIPTSADPYVAGVITRGAQLAVDQANAAGGVKIGSATYSPAIKRYDDGGQPQQAAANVDAAIHDGAVALIEDGIGMSSSAGRSEAAGVPEITTTDGDSGLLGAENQPPHASLFRVGIPNDAAVSVLSAYIAKQTKTVALLHDDSANGRDGADQLQKALPTAGVALSPASPIEVPAGSPTMDAQAQQIRAANPGGVAIWGSDVFLAKAVNTLREAGLTQPIFTGPLGGSPTVRQVAGNARSDGLRFATGRMTSESDETSFGKFEQALAQDHLGPTDAGVTNAAGQEIRQPNDQEFYAYDAVHLVIAALQKQGSVKPGSSLLSAIGGVRVKSANGDNRGFNTDNHEAFSDDDVYIAVIHDNQYQPVKDEELSATLPTTNQILAEFQTS